MYGPGGQSDEVLIFKIDGTGRLDFINFTLSTAYEFQWFVESPNRLTVIGTRTLQVGDNGKTVENSDDILNVINATYQIAFEDTPSGNRMRVLRVKLIDGVSDRYGFVREDIAGFEEPHFE